MIFILGAVVLMAVDHRHNHLEQVRAALSTVIYPVQYAVNLPVDLGKWTLEALATRERLQEENTELRAEMLVLKAQLEKYSALQAENIRLRQLLDSSFRLGDQVLVAGLLAVDMDPYRHQVLIDKGSNAGVFVGQPVVDALGVTGQVTHVGPVSASVMLITDPSNAIPVQVNRNGLRAIAMGTGSTEALSIPFLPNNADIRPGDLLISSGLGGHFPHGYPVARVTEVRQNPGAPFATVEAAPTARLDRSREVLLVWSPKRPIVAADARARAQPEAANDPAKGKKP